MDRDLYRYKKPVIAMGGPRSYPHTWEVASNIWELKFSNKIAGGALGMCDPSNQRMYIKLGQSRIEIFRTFMHEALHAMEFEYDHSFKHEDIERLELWLADFMTANAPSLAAILFP